MPAQSPDLNLLNSNLWGRRKALALDTTPICTTMGIRGNHTVVQNRNCSIILCNGI